MADWDLDNDKSDTTTDPNRETIKRLAVGLKADLPGPSDVTDIMQRSQAMLKKRVPKPFRYR